VHRISTLCALVFILLLGGRPPSAHAQCQSWAFVGPTGFSTWTIYNIQQAVAPDGTPYVLYGDYAHGGKATVKKYNGSNWVTVGTEGFSSTWITPQSFGIDNSGIPYAYFLDSTTYRLMKFNGSAWIDIPLAAIPNGSFKLSPDGTPYIAYNDYNVTLIKYNGSTWDTVGNNTLSYTGSTPYLMFDAGGTPYVTGSPSAFELALYKLTGSDWNMAGSIIDSGFFRDVAGAVNSAGIPYLGYYSYNDNAYHVEKFDGTAWSTVGDVISDYFSGGTMAADDTGGVYMCYSVGYGSSYAKRYNGSLSITIGGGPIPGANAPTIAIHNNTPYVAYSDPIDMATVVKMLELSAANSPSSANICTGATTTLSNATPGGYWSSTNSTVASVGSSTGIVTGIAGGGTAISYNYGTCSALAMVTVNPSAGYITGFKVLNAGTTTSLTATTPGGTWTSSNPSLATVNSGGIVSGVASGTTTISYGISGACGSAVATAVVTVNAASAPSCITWKKVGGPASASANSIVSTDWNSPIAMKTAPNGTPYIVFSDPNQSNQLTVKRYNGTNWVVVGTAGFTTGLPDNITIALDGLGTPYVAYRDYTTYLMHVMKFDGTAWVSLGDPNALWGNGYTPSIVVTGSGDVILQYLPDAYTYNGTRALRFNGTDWIDIGATTPGGFAGGTTTNIACDNAGAFYSAYYNGSSLNITKYNGSNWVVIASTPVPMGTYPWSLSIDKDGACYIGLAVYGASYGGANTVEILKYNGSIWNMVGDTINATVENSPLVASAADGSVYLYYSDYMTSLASVRKLIGGTWTIVGQDLFSGGVATLALANDGTPYLATQQWGYDSTLTGINKVWVTTPGLFDNTITGPSIVCSGGGSLYQNTSLTYNGVGNDWSTQLFDTVASSLDDAGAFGFSSGGVTTISYTVAGCTATKTVTANANTPPSITGTRALCNGASTTLSGSASGGSWSSDNTAVATIGSATGIVTGIGNGTATISYVVSSGCGAGVATAVVTVSAIPTAASITGALSTCIGSSTTLSTVVTGGTWSSGNATVATIDPSSGVATGVSTGTSSITYTVNTTCGVASTNAVVTVNAIASAGSITGTLSVCSGNNTTLSNTATGGSWSSSNAGIATVGSFNGIVSGTTAGTSIITYSVTNTCGTATTSTVVTVNAAPTAGSIAGTLSVCAANNTTLSNAVTDGTWASSNTGIATTGSSSGIVSGISAGTSTITYTTNGICGTANTTAVVTVNAIPSAGSITGTLSVCTSNNTTLSNGATGGTWSSSNTAIATINTSTGVVSGMSAGNTTISYTVSGTCGSVITTAVVTVNATPSAGTITGGSAVAIGGAITLTDAASGGVWSASNGNATVSNGVVTGITAGTTTISYTVSNGCGSNVAITIVTVTATAPTSITGTLSVCGGATTTLSSTPGGIWSSANNSVATVGSTTGIVFGVSPGVIAIKYTLAGTVTTVNVTVNPQPNGITGTSYLCQGSTVTLSSSTTGATWSSSNTSAATIGTSGVVSGVGAGTTTISYTGSNSCARSIVVTVNGRPDITGTTIMCAGSMATLSASMAGGAWGGGSAVATVNNGVVSGLSAGTTNITYVVGSCYNSIVVTVIAQPAVIGGIAKVCPGSTVTLTDATTGGTWSGTNSIATVDVATGAITGVATGTALVSYTAPNGCSRSVVATVNPVPTAISGTAGTCEGSTTTLTNSSPTYSWTSNNTGVATITSTGIVVGVSAGTATVTFTASGTYCTANTVVTINGTPAAIGGLATACIGATTTLTNTTSGGSWSSGNTSIAIIDAVTGVVTGATAGSVIMTYATGSGCYKTRALTVGTATVAIVGTTTACVGGTSTLTSWGTGTWSSSNTAVATIPTATTGTVQGMSAGTAIITFLPTGNCPAVTTVTVVTPPAPITGTTVICSGQTSSLSTTSTGGTWSSSNTAVAAVGSATGIVSGVGNSGTVTITYAYNATCRTTTNFTVKTLPNVIGGTYSVCATAATTLSDVTAAGTWSSSNTAVATVGTGINWGYGAVSGLTAGTTTISYTISATGCARSVVVTVDPCSRPMGNETTTTSAFELYPNPTTGSFTVITESAGTLQVFTLDGREVAQYPISNGINNLALSKEMASGVYMCRYNTSDGNTVIIRLVLEH
jgi:hypothetical protein